MIQEITVITGPTCSGKTAKALDFARENNAEIISCDSVQVYRGMDIGSAKPSKSELEEIKHYIIDVEDVASQFDIAKYIQFAKDALKEITSKGKNVVVTGGSGFYLKAWFSAVTDSIEISEEVKNKAEEIENSGGATALADALLKIDAFAPKYLDINNPRRTRKALERCLASGKSVGEIFENFKKLPCPMGELKRNLTILNPDNEELFPRIKARTQKMVDEGLIDETRNLIQNGILDNLSAKSAIGYRETIDWINNSCTDTNALVESITTNTIALVKKQRKYFRNNLL